MAGGYPTVAPNAQADGRFALPCAPPNATTAAYSCAGMGWLTSPQPIYLTFTPRNTTVGPLNLTLTFSADNFAPITTAPNITVIAQLSVVRADVVQPAELSGVGIVVRYELAATGTSVGGETVRVPAGSLNGTAGLRWGTSATANPAAVCSLIGAFYSCTLPVGFFPIRLPFESQMPFKVMPPCVTVFLPERRGITQWTLFW